MKFVFLNCIKVYRPQASSSMIFKFFLDERLDYLNVGGFRPSQKGCHYFEETIIASAIFFFFFLRLGQLIIVSQFLCGSKISCEI